MSDLDEGLIARVSGCASRRLQGVLDVRNGTPFIPHALNGDVQGPQNRPSHGHHPGLWSYLQAAFRENGYRMLRADAITFRGEVKLPVVVPGPEAHPGIQTHGEERSNGQSATLLTMNSLEGSIDLYEVLV